jgi:hypothetical protein
MNTVVGAAGRWALIALWLALLAAGCGTSVSVPDVDVDGSARDSAEQEGATNSDAARDAPMSPSMDAGGDAGGNEACDRPTLVSPGTMLTNVSTAGASVSTVACLPAFRGPLRFYSIDVPAGQVLDVTASAVGSMAPVAIRVFESCDGACINAAPSSVQWHNRSLSPRAVIVAIGGQGAEPITFNAVFTARNTVPGDTCAAPIDVSSSMAIRVEGVPESAQGRRSATARRAALGGIASELRPASSSTLGRSAATRSSACPTIAHRGRASRARPARSRLAER